jgi:hypothetical protein
MPDYITPALISQASNSNFYGLKATMASWTIHSFTEFPTIMDLGDVKILTLNQCIRKYTKLMHEISNLHWRCLCSVAEPYIVMEYVSTNLLKYVSLLI